MIKIFTIFFMILLTSCATETNVIKIGFSGPMTGDAALWGENMLAGVNLALKEVNDDGGIKGKQIELIVEDDKCSSKSVEGVNKLVHVDKVSALVGFVCSAAAGPALPVAQENEVPVVLAMASAPHLTVNGNHIFRVYPSDSSVGKRAAEFVYNTLGKRKTAIIYVQNDWGQGLSSVFEKSFVKLGGEVVYSAPTIQGELNFKTELTKSIELGAEAIFSPLHVDSGVAAAKQIKELGIDIPVLGGDFFDTEDFITSGYAEGIMYIVGKVNLPENFKEEILALNPDLKVSIGAPLGYDAAKVLFQAIARSEAKGTTIKEELEKTNYKGISNPEITFDNHGDVAKPLISVKIIKNGKSVDYE